LTDQLPLASIELNNTLFLNKTTPITVLPEFILIVPEKLVVKPSPVDPILWILFVKG